MCHGVDSEKGSGFLQCTERVPFRGLWKRWRHCNCVRSRFQSADRLRFLRSQRLSAAKLFVLEECGPRSGLRSGLHLKARLEDNEEALWEALERDVSGAETVGKLPPPLRTELLSKIREFVEDVAHRQAALGDGDGDVALSEDLLSTGALRELQETKEQADDANYSPEIAAEHRVQLADSSRQYHTAHLSTKRPHSHSEATASEEVSSRDITEASRTETNIGRAIPNGPKFEGNTPRYGRRFVPRSTRNASAGLGDRIQRFPRQISKLNNARASTKPASGSDPRRNARERNPSSGGSVRPPSQPPRSQKQENRRSLPIRNGALPYAGDKSPGHRPQTGRRSSSPGGSARRPSFPSGASGSRLGSEEDSAHRALSQGQSQSNAEEWGQFIAASEAPDRHPKGERSTESEEVSFEHARMRYAQFRGMLSLALREVSESSFTQGDRRDHRMGRLSPMLHDAISLLGEAGIEKLVTTGDINDLLSCLSRLRLLGKLEEVFELTESRGIPRDNRTYSLMIDALCKAKKIDAAIDIFENYVVRAAALDAMSVSGRHQRTTRVYPTIVMYNMLIAGCARTLRLDKAFEFFERMQSPPDNFEPDSYTYCALLDACAKCSNTELALHVFDEIERKGSRVDNAVYGALMGAVARAGDRRLAFAVWGLMRRRGLTPSNAVFVYLMEICAADGDYLRGFELLREMRAWNRAPTFQIYSSLMHACGNGGQPEYAMAVLERMKLDGITPSELTYCILIEAWSRIQRLDRAFGVFRDMRADGIQPRMRTANALLAACWHCQNLQAAHWLYIALRSELDRKRNARSISAEDLDPSMKPWALAISTLIELSCDAGEHDHAVSTYLADAAKLGLLQAAHLRSVLRPSLKRLRDALFRQARAGTRSLELRDRFLGIVGSEEAL